MSNPLRVVFLAAGLALAPSPVSQDRIQDRTQHPDPFEAGRHTASVGRSAPPWLAAVDRAREGVQRDEDQVRGFGRDYSARFATTGTEFLAAFGERAPRAISMELRLASVGRGAQRLPVRAPHAEPTVVESAGEAPHVEFVHEGGIRERYHCRNEGMEFSVLLERPVGGTGDLHVRMDLDTELVVPEGRHEAGIRLGAGALGAITVGGVVGIDADGRRCEGWIESGNGRLDLVLPAPFVGSARWPLLVDPLVGVEFALGTGPATSDPDLAYDPATDTYLLVYTRTRSASSQELFLQRLHGDGSPNRGPTLVTRARTVRGKVAFIARHGTFVIGALADHSGGPTGELLAAVFDPRGGGLSYRYPVSGQADLGAGFDVAGILGTEEDDALFVYYSATAGAVRAFQFQGVTQSPTPFDFTTIHTTPTAPGSLAITRQVQPRSLYAIAWTGEDAAGHHVMATVCDTELTSHSQVLRLDGGGHQLHDVAIAASDDGFLLVHARREAPGVAGDSDIYAHHLSLWAGALSSRFGSFPIENDAGDDESDPAVAWLGEGHYVVAWRDVLVPGYDVAEIATLNVLDDEPRRCGREHSALVSTLASSRNPSFASNRATGGSTPRALLLWDSEDVVSGDRSNYGVFVERMGAGGPVNDLGGGCGLSGVAGTNGPFAFGNRDFAFTLTGANGGTLTVAACRIGYGISPSFFHCGPGCALLDGVTSLYANVDASGNAEVPIPVTCNGALFGVAVNAQFAILTPNANPCGIAPVSLSNTLQAFIGD